MNITPSSVSSHILSSQAMAGRTIPQDFSTPTITPSSSQSALNILQKALGIAGGSVLTTRILLPLLGQGDMAKHLVNSLSLPKNIFLPESLQKTGFERFLRKMMSPTGIVTGGGALALVAGLGYIYKNRKQTPPPTFVEKAGAVLSTTKSAVSSNVSSAVKTLGNNQPAIAGLAGAVGGAGLGSFLGPVGMVVGMVTGGLLGNNFMKSPQETLEHTRNTGQHLVNGVTSTIYNAASGVKSGIYNAASGVKSGIYNAASGVKSGIYNAGSGIYNAASGVKSGIYNSVSGAVSTSEHISAIKTDIVNNPKKTLEVISAGLGGVAGLGLGITTGASMGASCGSIAGSFGEVAGNVLGGIAGGVAGGVLGGVTGNIAGETAYNYPRTAAGTAASTAAVLALARGCGTLYNYKWSN